MRSAFLLFFAAFALMAGAKTETGELNGAQFRVDIPPQWNGGLLMYCHGYAEKPVTFDDKPPSKVLAEFLEKGYAVAQSGYASGGWAIQEAVEDTEALRRYFILKYGPVKETYVTGHSMGGFLTMVMIERFPGIYKAGLALCGPLAAPSDFMLRGVFDTRIMFDYYFPGVLPPPDNVPADFRNTKERRAALLAVLQSKLEIAELLRSRLDLKTLEDLANGLTFGTDVLRELQRRAGGNPFDNTDVVYHVNGDSNALNDGVKRYQADPRAARYLTDWYTPTGRPSAPMFAIHTTYDPLVPASIPNSYAVRSREAGASQLFVQQYVKHDGHCAISPEETASAFDELRHWADDGARPAGGLLPVH